MMENAFKYVVSMVLVIIVCSLAFCLSGCWEYYSQPGETTAEGHRRHLRNLSINQLELMGDIDRAVLFDQPSKTTVRKIN